MSSETTYRLLINTRGQYTKLKTAFVSHDFLKINIIKILSVEETKVIDTKMDFDERIS